MSNDYALGRLIHLDPREVWKHEALNFTPWLADNIGLLNEALGLEIEIVDREVPVGDFAVDLFGREASTGLNVIIENQLAATDHGHLGQLVTYAAGLDATVIVWVTPFFREEHAQAITWLNSRTRDGLQFFGVQLEVVRIGDSLPAPLFKVVAQPIEWSPDKGSSSVRVGVTGRQQAYHDFFIDLLAKLKLRSPNFTNTTRFGYDNWLGFSAGRTGFGYTVSFVSGNKFRVEIYIDLGDQFVNKAIFDQFQSSEIELNSLIGDELIWHKLEHRRASRICVETEGNIFSSPEILDDLKVWGIQRLVRFREVFTPRLKSLVVPVPESSEAPIESENFV